MANKDFGVKKIELIGSSGTPNLTSPTNLNLNANTVAISTDVTIGGKVQSDIIVGTGYSVGIGSTQPTAKLDVDGTVNVTGAATVAGILDANGGLQANTAIIEDLTDNRVVIAGSGGELEDDANLTYDGVDLSTNSLIVTDLTDNRVLLAGTGGSVEDDANLTFNGTQLAVGVDLDVVGVATAASFVRDGGTSSQFLMADGSVKSRTREVVSGSTTSITNNGIGNTDIAGFKAYTLMKVGLSTAGWLRLYTDSASRTADAGRSIGEDPTPGSGVIAEVVTTGLSTTQNISPFVIGGNMDDPATTTMYVAITNTSGVTTSITANLTILQLED